MLAPRSAKARYLTELQVCKGIRNFRVLQALEIFVFEDAEHSSVKKAAEICSILLLGSASFSTSSTSSSLSSWKTAVLMLGLAGGS
ncbi:hypothetical protein Tco_0185697 [Tanacetum coccineum]